MEESEREIGEEKIRIRVLRRSGPTPRPGHEGSYVGRIGADRLWICEVTMAMMADGNPPIKPGCAFRHEQEERSESKGSHTSKSATFL